MNKDTINPFDKDVILNGGYLYTTNTILSSTLANERLTIATTNMIPIANKKVIDVGCGDGSYTYELFKRFKPKEMVGVDASRNAIKLANVLYGKNKGVRFIYKSIYKVTELREKYDVAIIRGVIHHVDYPKKAINEVAKIASNIIILEPNGYNPLLKAIEKVSLYHRIHKEKSYFPFKIRKWLNEVGFTVVKDSYVGLVPFFCPDGMARFLKKIESPIESIPCMRNFLCGVYVVLSKNKNIT